MDAVVISPIAPLSTKRRMRRTPEMKRRFWMMAWTLPVSAARSTRAAPSASDVAIGFSLSIWQPAFSAVDTTLKRARSG